MSKKTVLIIVGLLIIQIGIYFIVNRNEKNIGVFTDVVFDKYKPDENGLLDLSRKGLIELPKGVLEYPELKEIILDRNDFQKFPYEILSMPNLTKISIKHNRIGKVDFSNVDIQCDNLKELFIAHNWLSEANGLERFENLYFLNLRGNQLNQIPDARISTLEILRLTTNFIHTLESTQFHPNLHYLDLGENNVQTFIVDENIDYKLRQLTLNGVKYTTFPVGALKFKKLKNLQIHFSDIANWNLDNFIKNDSLGYLDLNANQLTNTDIDLQYFLPNLGTLLLRGNQLKKINIEHFNLKELDLATNDEIEELKITAPNLERFEVNPNIKKAFIDNINTPKMEGRN